jgi:ribosomal protein S18 acetylase RimI-like enzyme
MQTISIVKVSISQINRQIAFLHYQTFNKGLLPKLGISFLQSLYSFLVTKELVLVCKEEDKVLGFVSCAISSRGIMKRFMFYSPHGIFKLLFALIKKPGLIKPLLATLRASGLSEQKSGEDIPETELLSISVSPQAQQTGIGTQLVTALEHELRKRNVNKYKVITWKTLEGTNKFYLKNGLVLAKQISIHGKEILNVYVKEIYKKRSEVGGRKTEDRKLEVGSRRSEEGRQKIGSRKSEVGRRKTEN